MPEIDIPWRPELEFFEYRLPAGAARGYAEQLVSRGIADQSDLGVLETALERAALYYFFGQTILAKLQEQKGDDEIVVMLREFVELARPPKNRPIDYGGHYLIWHMAEVWEALGRKTGTAEGISATGRDYVSRFQGFCEDWMKILDPDRKALPKRTTYRNALKKRGAALYNS